MTAATLNIRESNETLERQTLHPLAARSAESRGREQSDAPCDIRTAFQRDRDRILHSKAFRRLMHKTQVFISPAGDHYRTRLTHSLEVSQIARTIARALRLNEDLTESIALGHDLGHPPFGHTGERVLAELSPFGFHHQAQSLRIARVLEDLNLTVEVLDGLEGLRPESSEPRGLRPESSEPSGLGPRLTPEKSRFLTLEAQVVDLADRMAYLHHDAEDAARAGLMRDEDLPSEILSTLGATRQARLDRMVLDLIETSRLRMDEVLRAGIDSGRKNMPACIELTSGVRDAMMALRQWMFEHVYLDPAREEQAGNVRRVLGGLLEFYVRQPEAISASLPAAGPDYPPERRALDYVAGMTDRFAIEAFKRHLLPQPCSVPGHGGVPGIPAMIPDLAEALP